VPEIADWCAVDLRDADGDRVPVSVVHADASKSRLAEELRSYDRARPDPEQGIGRVLRTGEPVLYPEIPDEMLVAAAVDERHLELLRSVGFRSAAVVPIRLGRRVLGTMTLVSADSRRVLDRPEVELAEQVAARAAVAIENSRLYSQRSAIAHTLQQSLLPEELPEIPGYELANLYIPALAGTEVGGDFYDVWEARGGWLLVIGDVTGKGPEAAAVTALVRHTLRATSEFVSSPAELLAHLDRALKQQRQRPICTAICLRLEGDQLDLAVGGHPLPIEVGPTGAWPVGEFGFILGAFEDAEWHDTRLELAPGHTLVLFTDGVTDAVGRDGARYGFSRLRSTLGECWQLSAGDLIDTLGNALRSFQVGEHADDTAVLAVRRQPASDRPASDTTATSEEPGALPGHIEPVRTR
jgi:serine phosphatase RsbU (regulator of sigma subunit)